MNKGQIFSIDFIIAMILMLVFLGGLMSIGEVQSYEKKEAQIRNNLKTKTEAALIVLTNSQEYGCTLDTGETLAYSLDSTKITSVPHIKLKEDLGLVDYNLSLLIDGVVDPNHSENSSSPNIYAAEINILYCGKGITYSDINSCYTGSCPANIAESKLTIEVSK